MTIAASTGAEPAMRAQGCESILAWTVYDHLDAPRCLFSDQSDVPAKVETLPPLDYSLMVRLESNYVQGVQNKNPILDLSALHQMILQVAENGADWSVETCLVTLVCALGAVTETFPVSVAADNDMDAPPSIDPDRNAADFRLARQFWNLAAKRLGLVLGQNSVQAAQCLCLAGIWYMHMMQPLEAWKHFDLAGTVWHSLILVSTPPRAMTMGVGDGGPQTSRTSQTSTAASITAMQALYFTIWKSECELRMELSLPSPVLDSINFPYAFPTPPATADAGHEYATETVVSERSWYFFLSDIAARHLLNRLLRTDTDSPATTTNTTLTPHTVRRMIAQADMIETQVTNWHASLPSTLYFDVPVGYTPEPLLDDLSLILRYRYFAMRELVGRPFVRLCVERSIDHLDAATRPVVLSSAGQSLRYCILKLHGVLACRHQGIWLALRVSPRRP